MDKLPLWTIEIRSSQYLPADMPKPRYAIGQLVKTNIDGYSNSVDCLSIQGVSTLENEWIYCCEFVACIQPEQGMPEWDAGERHWLPEIDLDPLTANDEAKLHKLESELCMQ